MVKSKFVKISRENGNYYLLKISRITRIFNQEDAIFINVKGISSPLIIKGDMDSFCQLISDFKNIGVLQFKEGGDNGKTRKE